MKKKLVAFLMAACVSAMLLGTVSGCGKKTEGENTVTEETGTEQGETASNENVEVSKVFMKDLSLDQLVDLGDYQSLRVARPEVTVPDEDVQEEMERNYISMYPAELGVKDRPVEEGDTANIDYVGKKDGVAFDGGTASGTNLTIGSGRFIDGFESGLIGVMPGETVDLNLTFPEIYSNAELAGKDVVFTVTVNYIIPAEMSDDAVKEFGLESVTNLAEFRQYIYDYLYEVAEYENSEQYESNVMGSFLEQCQFQEFPAELIQYNRNRIKEYLESSAAMYSLDADTYVGYVYGTDLETVLDYFCESSTQQNVALYRLAQLENLVVTEEAVLMEKVKEYAADAGYEDPEEYLTALNASLDEFAEDYAVSMAYEKLLELVDQK